MESPAIMLVVSAVMVVLLSVTVMDAYFQQAGRHYDIPAWIIAMCSGTVSAVVWWRFKKGDDDDGD